MFKVFSRKTKKSAVRQLKKSLKELEIQKGRFFGYRYFYE